MQRKNSVLQYYYMHIQIEKQQKHVKIASEYATLCWPLKQQSAQLTVCDVMIIAADTHLWLSDWVVLVIKQHNTIWQLTTTQQSMRLYT